jgi:hypothetical protein
VQCAPNNGTRASSFSWRNHHNIGGQAVCFWRTNTVKDPTCLDSRFIRVGSNTAPLDKVDTSGDLPPPRYFHSVCPLGDTKLVCYGGMSPAPAQGQNQPVAASQNPQDVQPEVVVMSDIYIYDAPTKTWSFIPTQDTPQGRYAHCATILPSSATFSSTNAASSALHHNPPGTNPNQGTIGVNIDGTGGAEMVVVGGQDSANHYIEQISVFNLRSLKWTSTQQLGKSCGAYRSVVAPLPGGVSSRLGKTSPTKPETVAA